MSDLVGNPEDRFSHNEAHIIIYVTFSAIIPASIVFSSVRLVLILALRFFSITDFVICNCINVFHQNRFIVFKCTKRVIVIEVVIAGAVIEAEVVVFVNAVAVVGAAPGSFFSLTTFILLEC